MHPIDRKVHLVRISTNYNMTMCLLDFQMQQLFFSIFTQHMPQYHNSEESLGIDILSDSIDATESSSSNTHNKHT